MFSGTSFFLFRKLLKSDLKDLLIRDKYSIMKNMPNFNRPPLLPSTSILNLAFNKQYFKSLNMKTTVNVYLTFNGNCKEAFEFYRSVFGGEFLQMSTFDEMPPQEGMPPISKEEKDLIMHVSLPISKETVLMGSDTGGEWAKNFKKGTNFSISVNTNNKQEAERIFRELSKGGKVMMPMEKTFWGSYFGMFADKFEINWMVSFDENPHD